MAMGLLWNCVPVPDKSLRRNQAMARPLRIEFPNAYYHVINRGEEGISRVRVRSVRST